MSGKKGEEPLEEITVAVELQPGEGEYKQQKNPSPEFKTSICGQLFYTWITSIFRVARRKNKIGEELEYEDLYDLPSLDETNTLLEGFDKRWQKYQISWPNGSPPSNSAANWALASSIFGVIRWRFFASAIARFLNSSVQFANPILINYFLIYIQELYAFNNGFPGAENPGVYQGYLWAAGLVLAFLFNGILEAWYFWLVARCGWQVRSMISTSVFRKSLRLSMAARELLSEGEIVNFMQIDAQRLETFILIAVSLWDGLYQIAGYVLIIYFLIGEATFVGLAIMLIAIPIQAIMFVLLKKFLSKVAEFTDKRVKSTNEALQGILGVKMAAWEENFIERIKAFRKKELTSLKYSLYLSSFTFAYITAIPAVTAVGAISFYALRNGRIDAATLFAVIAAFSSLRFPLSQYPQAFQALVDGRIGLKRLAIFLSMDEAENKSRKHFSGDNDTAIRINDGQFYWTREDASLDIEKELIQNKKAEVLPENAEEVTAEMVKPSKLPVLEDINIEIKSHELVAIVGSVGSGKSSLLNSILGETHQSRGSMEIQGSIAYAAQTAWIQNTTLRNNVLFGLPFDEDKYWEVIRVCQLEEDLDQLQDADQTIIGEKGINLSGGQAQRVSVARAAYSNADIILLDDPISALDTEVGRALFEECVVQFLGDRTRIMVTNQLNLLQTCDRILVISNGEGEEVNGPRGPSIGHILENGSFQDLMRANGSLKAMMDKFQGEKEKEQEEVEEDENRKAKLKERKQGRIELQDKHELMQIEERAHGAVKFEQYKVFIRAGGGWTFFTIVILAQVTVQAITVGNNLVISIWTDNVNDDGSYKSGSLTLFLAVYAGSAALLALSSFARGIAMMYLTLNASRNLHSDLLNGILSAPMSFFDTTPKGRILSRFSKDINQLDLQFPQILNFFLFSTIAMIFSIGTIAFTTYYFLATIPFLAYIYIRIIQYYRPVARDSKRLESISRSPVYAYFSETISGLSTIRAYGKTKGFSDDNSMKIDKNIRGFYITRVVEMWLNVRLRLLSTVISAFASALILVAVDVVNLSPGIAGLGLTTLFLITALLGSTVRAFATVEASMNSVERLNYYATQIEREAGNRTDNPPAEDWPSEGHIVITDLKMRYRKGTPLVLKGLSVDIPGGSTVGIVGRTGSGKSSIMLSLLRIVEPESGTILIDDIDISTIGLYELRKKVSIVPQSPVIFSGTIRSNLDPFNNYSNDEVWASLDQTNMKTTVEGLDEGLDSIVAEYGNNFSQGQRQLLCMSRSLLAQAKILLLDEATSSIDYETDALIQETIRSSFQNCTILTIAHRIQTVIDNDYILVVKAGTVAEFDQPKVLLADRSSEFRSIIDEMPPEMAANLIRMANQ